MKDSTSLCPPSSPEETLRLFVSLLSARVAGSRDTAEAAELRRHQNSASPRNGSTSRIPRPSPRLRALLSKKRQEPCLSRRKQQSISAWKELDKGRLGLYLGHWNAFGGRGGAHGRLFVSVVDGGVCRFVLKCWLKKNMFVVRAHLRLTQVVSSFQNIPSSFTPTMLSTTLFLAVRRFCVALSAVQ